jgi:hypothetical protein
VPLLRAKPDLAAEARTLAAGKASGALARALLAAAADEPERRAELLAALLPVYADKVLSAKERGGPGALACWGALAAAADEGQVTGQAPAAADLACPACSAWCLRGVSAGGNRKQQPPVGCCPLLRPDNSACALFKRLGEGRELLQCLPPCGHPCRATAHVA